MKSKIIYLFAALTVLAAPAILRAQDKTNEAKPSREELREKFQKMTPEERRDWFKNHPEARQAFGGGGPGGPGSPGGADIEKRREEMKRMAKDLGLDPEELQKLPMEERIAKY